MLNTKSALMCMCAGVAVLVATSAARAQDLQSGTYFSFSGGANMPSSSSVTYRSPNIAGGAASRAQTGFDTGYIFSGALGYRFGSGLRTELEVNHRKAGVDHIGGVDAAGKQRVWGLTANALYDFGEIATLRPYVGAGVGVGWNKWSGVQTLPAGAVTYTDRDTALQWQAIGGLSKPFSQRVDGFVEYRYIGLEQNKFNGVPLGATASRHDDRSHNILVGVRYAF